jgi:plastocyanin domain-containing protein
MLETAVGILGTAVIGVFGWAFQLSNRVSVIEAENEGLRELINTKFAEVNRRLDRIEEKL